MHSNYKIIDSDTHVFEPLNMWGEYLEPEYQSFAPTPDMKIQGEDIYGRVSQQAASRWAQQILQVHPEARLKGFTNELHLSTMKQMGADISFIYPTVGLFILAMDTMQPTVAGAFTRAYNNWLERFCNHAPDQLKGVGLVNLHAPEEMVAELHRIVRLGCKAVCLRPNPTKGRTLSDPAYEPFWFACEELGIAVAIHEGTHSRLPTTGADRFHSRFAQRACSHPMEQMMALLSLIEGGVLERHPQLRVGFLESGCSWLLYWLWRLDEEYECHYWEVKDNVKMLPSDYFRRQCYVGFELSEPYLEQVIEKIGGDRLLFGSDYPHVHWGRQEEQPDILNIKQALVDRLPQSTVSKILWDNPARFYGLD